MKYMKLDQKGSIMAEYVWIDSNGGTRSKSKVSVIFNARVGPAVARKSYRPHLCCPLPLPGFQKYSRRFIKKRLNSS